MWDSFRYGVCYYPEQWDASRHESDVQRIADASFDFVRMGEGAWGYWEPSEGQYQFDLFDRVIEMFARRGIQTILGTPTYTGPAWISHHYPEVLRWDFNRIPMAHGSRRNFNYTSKKYLDLSDRICRALSEHYKDNPHVIAWQLDNEFNCAMDVSYSPSDTAAFREWLAEKYGSLDALNRAWGTTFWSQQYDGWEQIDLPQPTVTYHNPTQTLDEVRFISECVVRFARRQADILRAHNPHWKITHNGLFGNIDGPALSRELDFFSHDHYPLFSTEWTTPASALQQTRSLSFPFGIMEQQSGAGGQMDYLLRTPRPGQVRLWAWQSVAHGAKALAYFRWRTCPYGSEQQWHGLIDADDQDSRILREAHRTGQEFKSLPAEFFDSPLDRCVALFRDFDSETNERRIDTYAKSGNWETGKWSSALARRHVPADMVWIDSDLSGYRVIIAPHVKIVRPYLIQLLTDFITRGGTLILGAQSGSKDHNNHVVEMKLPGLWRSIAGIEIDDWTTLRDDESREAILPDGTVLPLATFVERINAIDADVIATWTGDDMLLKGAAAVTRRRVGRGAVYYIGGYCTPAAITALLDLFQREKLIASVVSAGEHVEALSLGRFLTLLNHSAEPQTIESIPPGRDLITNQSVKSTLTLSAYSVAVIDTQSE